MKKIITTLPISIWSSPTLSICVSPYIAKLIEKNTDLEWSVLAANLLWKKVELIDDNVLYNRVNEFVKDLNNLWINLQDIWIDKDNILSLLSIIDLLKEKWLIHEKNIEIKTCDCWTYESLATAWNYGLKKNLNSGEICSKCWSELHNEKIKWLMYHIRDYDYDIYPNRYKWHVNNYKNNYSEILISRSRDTGIKYNWYNIDIDFLWSMWLIDLKKKWLIPEIVLTNPSSLYNTYIAMSVYKSIEEDCRL